MNRWLVPVVGLALLTAPVVAGCGRAVEREPESAVADYTSCGPRTVDVSHVDVAPLAPAPIPELPATVSSFDGEVITVTDASRILAVDLYGSLAEIVFALGLGGSVVGRDTATTFEAAKDLPLVTPAGHDLSAEGILRLNPSVVLTDSTTGPATVIDQLRASGIPVVFFDPGRNLDGVPARMTAVAEALGVPRAGHALAARFAEELSVAADSTMDSRPTVAFLYLRGSAGVYLIGGDLAGSDAMIEAAGGIDAGSALGLQRFRPLTAEGLAAAAPDVLLVMTAGLESVGGVDALLQLPGIAQTPAASTRRVVDIDDGMLLTFGARSPRVVRALADALWCR
jgi:iron complex transport system substrate-binding protein